MVSRSQSVTEAKTWLTRRPPGVEAAPPSRGTTKARAASVHSGMVASSMTDRLMPSSLEATSAATSPPATRSGAWRRPARSMDLPDSPSSSTTSTMFQPRQALRASGGILGGQPEARVRLLVGAHSGAADNAITVVHRASSPQLGVHLNGSTVGAGS